MLAILLPRGIRNNNPGNIRLSKTVWQGQKPVQEDPDFIVFVSPLYGLRALVRLLLTYYFKYGLDTVASLLNRYAPPHENATDAYIQYVSQALKVKRTEKINLAAKPTLIALAQAIVRHENGPPPPGYPPFWYSPELYAEAANLIFK